MIKVFRAERTFTYHIIHIKDLRLREVNNFTKVTQPIVTSQDQNIRRDPCPYSILFFILILFYIISRSLKVLKYLHYVVFPSHEFLTCERGLNVKSVPRVVVRNECIEVYEGLGAGFGTKQVAYTFLQLLLSSKV